MDGHLINWGTQPPTLQVVTSALQGPPSPLPRPPAARINGQWHPVELPLAAAEPGRAVRAIFQVPQSRVQAIMGGNRFPETNSGVPET